MNSVISVDMYGECAPKSRPSKHAWEPLWACEPEREGYAAACYAIVVRRTGRSTGNYRNTGKPAIEGLVYKIQFRCNEKAGVQKRTELRNNPTTGQPEANEFLQFPGTMTITNTGTTWRTG